MSASYKPLPAAEELWELFSYNPLSGQLHWRVIASQRTRIDDPAGSSRRDYIYAQVNHKKYPVHRLIWAWVNGRDPDAFVDHIDGNKTNNQAWNLRRATRAQNGWNRSSHRSNTSGYKGVFRNHKNWRARIKANGRVYCLGTYKTPEEAHQAYCEAAARLHGEFAHVA